MKKLITKNREVDLKKINIYPADLPDDIQDIKLTGDKCIDLINLNLNIVKYELDNTGPLIHVGNCNINKLVLNSFGRGITIFDSTINNIYIKSEVNKLYLRNTPIPNFHGNVDLINEIEIMQ